MGIYSVDMRGSLGRPVVYPYVSGLHAPAWIAPTNSIQYRGVAGTYWAHDEDLNFERTDPLSMSIYLRLDGSRTAGGTERFIYSKRALITEWAGLYLSFSSDGKLTFVLSSARSTNAIVVQDSSALSTLTWYHAIVTYSGSSLSSGVKMYINGASRTLTSLQNNLSATTKNTQPVRFGYEEGTTKYFDGELCDFFMYNKELSAGEVTALYNSGTPLDPMSVSSAENIIMGYRLGTGDVTWPFIAPFVGGNSPSNAYSAGKFLGTIYGLATVNAAHP